MSETAVAQNRWIVARAVVPSRSWQALGVANFEAGVPLECSVAGAVGEGACFEDADVWCPAVHASWIPVHEFATACRDVAFRGPVAFWGRNRGPVDLEIDVRFKVAEEGEPLTAPDLTAPYYASRAWRNTLYRDVQVLKAPTDLWVMQEVFHEVRPDLVIETGTFRGGSALYFADLFKVMGADWAQVVTVDVEDRGRPSHDLVQYVSGSSTDAAVLDLMKAKAKDGNPTVLVVLDSDHSTSHVAAELRAYAPLVSEGSYLVVEDTNTPGPAQAVEEFLASPEGSAFKIDRSREKFGLTFNPGGWLKKGSRS